MRDSSWLADDVVLLDMGISDEGIFEIAFNEPIGGYVITWDDLQDLIEGTDNGGGRSGQLSRSY
jgi:hypothetical protein